MNSPSLLARFPYLCALYPQNSVIEQPKLRQTLEVDPYKPPNFERGKVQKKRKRKPTINVYEDPEAKKIRFTPANKNSTSGRFPLSSRVESVNSTPTPTPRLSDTPFPAWSAETFFHDDKENVDPAPTLPPTPYVSGVIPMPPAGPPPPLPPRPIINPDILVTRASSLREPRNMVLYEILGLVDWNATSTEILAAWRQTARGVHPDHQAEEDREVATLEMQQLNAAKDVLTDMSRRRLYHRTGELPFGL